MKDILSVFNNQKEYFCTGNTLNIKFRIDNLKKLKNIIKNNEDRIL